MNPPSSSPPPNDPSIQWARLEEDKIVLVRVIGRGSFQNAPTIKHILDETLKRGSNSHFIVDLRECPTMDSTFMGQLTLIASSQLARKQPQLVICNANEQNRRLLRTLGVDRIMDIRQGGAGESAAEGAECRPAAAPAISRVERIIQMVDAHYGLIAENPKNADQFGNVIKYLLQDLEREKKREEEEKKREEEEKKKQEEEAKAKKKQDEENPPPDEQKTKPAAPDSQADTETLSDADESEDRDAPAS